ncbi:hypothetical protein D3C72_1682890 [compost metagenome]
MACASRGSGNSKGEGNAEPSGMTSRLRTEPRMSKIRSLIASSVDSPSGHEAPGSGGSDSAGALM